ncbi:DUF2938 domain-containing protein [Pseudomonas rubra]|uniref:DUF2938 domain-containing protein n=1 Tax=Pseudomonas rubra TaxID=2942627 RepID=A0ABT5P9Z1_9PSED|nr:DUF2938 domain-containing protein [Pseudomonas rubra]MDD1015121.1 DUF2938 domain-containing protein [Pseudomonas rubra]MDD1037700.1 DUF2938 domain-containing protein [Pseudomonas rubra]MDD1157380.1 DUF2938 domain-containing protein [Pseudomonas rubra]
MLEAIVLALLIGLTATALADLWSLFQQRVLGMAGANWALVGRWIGHMPRGQFIHHSIAKAPALAGERLIGWSAHYVIGVMFAGLLLAVCGVAWARQPTFVPAFVLGLATVAAPYLIMQPGMGAGFFASKTPKPNTARARSLLNHGVFGVALYLAGVLWAALLQP